MAQPRDPRKTASLQKYVKGRGLFILFAGAQENAGTAIRIEFHLEGVKNARLLCRSIYALAAGRRNPSPAEARRATTNAATRITTSAPWRARATQHARVCATALPPTTPTRRPSGGGGGDGGEHDTGASHHRASADENERENGREEQGGSSTEELRQKAHRHTAADRPPHANKAGDKNSSGREKRTRRGQPRRAMSRLRCSG